MAGSSRSRASAPASQHAKTTPPPAATGSALESARRILPTHSNTAPHVHSASRTASSTNSSTVELLHTLVRAHHTLIHLLVAYASDPTLAHSAHSHALDSLLLTAHTDGTAPLSYLHAAQSATRAAASRHTAPTGLRPGHLTIKVLSPIQPRAQRARCRTRAARAAAVPPSPPLTAAPQPPKVQLPAKSPPAAAEVAAALLTHPDVAKAASRRRSRSRSRVRFSEAQPAAAQPAAVLTPPHPPPPPAVAASAPDEPTSSPSGHTILRRCPGTTGSSIVSLRSVEVLQLGGRTLARVSAEPGAIDAQYARKPNRSAGAWLEYDVGPSRDRKRGCALRVRQAVALRPPTKHDRATFGALTKSDEVWQILPIGEAAPIASC